MTSCSCKVKLNTEQQLAHGSLVSAAQHHMRADSYSYFLADLSDLSGNTDYPCCIGPFGKHFDMTEKSLQSVDLSFWLVSRQQVIWTSQGGLWDSP